MKKNTVELNSARFDRATRKATRANLDTRRIRSIAYLFTAIGRAEGKSYSGRAMSGLGSMA